MRKWVSHDRARDCGPEAARNVGKQRCRIGIAVRDNLFHRACPRHAFCGTTMSSTCTAASATPCRSSWRAVSITRSPACPPAANTAPLPARRYPPIIVGQHLRDATPRPHRMHARSGLPGARISQGATIKRREHRPPRRDGAEYPAALAQHGQCRVMRRPARSRDQAPRAGSWRCGNPWPSRPGSGCARRARAGAPPMWCARTRRSSPSNTASPSAGAPSGISSRHGSFAIGQRPVEGIGPMLQNEVALMHEQMWDRRDGMSFE